jgi:hypothetical protein
MKLIKPVGCVCNHESGVTCMLHADLDAYIIAQALNKPDIEPEHARKEEDEDVVRELR